MRLQTEYIVLLIVAAVAVAGITLPLGPSSAPHALLIGPVCSDSDGRDPSSVGNVVGVTREGGLYISIDKCLSATSLEEQVCNGVLPGRDVIECGSPCAVGRCLPIAAAIEQPSPLTQSSGTRFGARTNILELNEPLGSVREAFGEQDLPLLRSGTISTRGGSSPYHQYLRFNRSSDFTSQRVVFGEDEGNNVGTFFFVEDGSTLFELLVQFDEGLRSRLDSGRLRDMEDRDINLLGTQYAIVSVLVNTNDVTFTLVGGPGLAEMHEGESRTFIIGPNEYEYTVKVISETTNEILLQVNGITLPKLRPGESAALPDGTLIGVRDIIATAKDEQSSIARVFLGASTLVLRDTNAADDAFSEGGATINNRIIPGSAVKIKMNSIGADRVIDSITYRATADALSGDLYVPPGEGVRRYLRNPEAMLAPGWDIIFNGLEETGTSFLRWNPSGNDEYRLEFTNQEGLRYYMPLMSTRLGGLRFGQASGSAERDLVFIEGSSATDYKIRPQDYVVLSSIDSSLVTSSSPVRSGFPGFSSGHTDNNAFTHILQYGSYDSTNGVLTFTDLASGTKQVTLAGGSGTLIVGGQSYAVNVDSSTGNIVIDQDGDGSFSGSTAVIATQGGALIVLGSSNPASGASVGSTNKMSLTTLQKQFDQSSGDFTLGITIEARAGNRIGISGLEGVTLRYLTSNAQIAQAMDDYGAFYEFLDPSSSTPETLTAEYPSGQRGADVRVVG